MRLCPACGSQLLPLAVNCNACWYQLPAQTIVPADPPARIEAAGLGIPNSRAAAFHPLTISTTPPPNRFRAAERRIQAAYRASVAGTSAEAVAQTG
jgi:hypothetical protein